MSNNEVSDMVKDYFKPDSGLDEDQLNKLKSTRAKKDTVVDFMLGASLGITGGLITGAAGLVRLIGDKKAGRLHPVLKSMPDHVLYTNVLQSHIKRGLATGLFGCIAHTIMVYAAPECSYTLHAGFTTLGSSLAFSTMSGRT